MANLLARTAALLRAPANELAFPLRASLRWSRGLPAPHDEPKDGLFAAPAAAARAADLRERFALGRLHAQSTRRVYAANLALLDRLEALFAGEAIAPGGADGVLAAVDVGCGDFHYATALLQFLRLGGAAPRPVALRGIELDGHGVYRDGHSRADHARQHAELAATGGGSARFEVANFLRVRLPPQDVVTMFYPFLTAYPLLRWGLPLSQLRPRALLQGAAAALRPGGCLVLVHQTDAEAGRARRLLDDGPLRLVREVPFASALDLDPAATRDRVGAIWRHR